MALDLEKHLTFYGQYHHDSVNVAIHIVCVPLLLFTGFLFATNTGSLLPLPNALSIQYLKLNLGTIAAILYSSLYVLMEPVAGALLAPILLSAAACCNYVHATYGSTANAWGIALHVVCWLAQFVGHGVFEKRAPALLDNLVQAIFLAPFFVWLEILFMLGYRQELKGRLDKSVEKEIEKFKSKKQSNGKVH